MMSWIFALLGLATAALGGGAIVMGWPLVPLERGWTLVIAGSALLSGGLLCSALAALIGETRRTRRAIERALEELAWARPIERMSSTTLPPEHEHEIGSPHPPQPSYAPTPATSHSFEKLEPVMPSLPVMPAAATLGMAETPEARREPIIEARPAMEHPARAPAPVSAEHEAAKEPTELQPARSFSVGDTSFVVFTDGTIEARTPKGARRFNSMEEVRSYLEESAAS